LTLSIYSRIKDNSSATGLWLGAATLIKLYPVALLPAFFNRGRWKMPATFAAIVIFGYSCYASVGSAVFGFLPAYAQEEGLETGGRYFLLTLANRTFHTSILPLVYVSACGAAMVMLCVWAFRRGSHRYAFISSALVIATMLNIFYSPHYPWYFLWLLPYLTIVPWRPAFYLVTAATFLFATNLGAAGEPMYRLNVLLYSGFALMAAYDLLTRFPRRSFVNYSESLPATLIADPRNT
jgi:hypothetical protein